MQHITPVTGLGLLDEEPGQASSKADTYSFCSQVAFRWLTYAVISRTIAGYFQLMKHRPSRDSWNLLAGHMYMLCGEP